MKKILGVVAIALAIGACAADAFLGWDCKDTAKLKEALAKSDSEVKPSNKRYYTFMLAQIENKEAVSTLDKSLAYMKEKFPTIGEAQLFQDICVCKRCMKESDFNADIFASKYAVDNDYVLYYFKVQGNDYGITSFTKDELKANIIEAYPVLINKDRVKLCSDCVDRYTNLTINEDTDDVVKNLKYMYRLTLPKLASNTEFKPVVVKLGLALKSRGVDVK